MLMDSLFVIECAITAICWSVIFMLFVASKFYQVQTSQVVHSIRNHDFMYST